MKRTIWFRWCAAGCLASLLSGGLALAQEPTTKRVRVVVEPNAAGQPQATVLTEDVAPAPQVERRVILLKDLPAAGPRAAVVEIVGEEAAAEAAREVKPSPYWIGVQLDPEPLPELLQKHLQVTAGVVVTEVFDDSPAAKVGVKPGDILLRAGKTKLTGPPDLIDAVTAAGEKPFKLALLRDGKELEIELTPAKRQETEAAPDATEANELLRALESNQLFRRHLVLPRAEAIWLGEGAGAKLPANVKVKISKEGEKPAEVHVERDGKTWEVDEKSLDKLPADLRGPVQNMLGGGLGAMRLTPALDRVQALRSDTAAAPAVSGVPALPPGVPFRPQAFTMPIPPNHPGVEAKLDSILKKLNAMTTESQQRMEQELKRLRADVEALQKRAEAADQK